MPNWCSNELKITGSPEKLDNLLEKSYNKEENIEFSLNSLIPMPESEKEEGWYEWRLANWGTKWDLSDISLNRVSEDTVELNFSTAWSPPTEGLTKISELYPDLIFDLFYMEPGADYCGRSYIESGILSDDCVTYSERFGATIDFNPEESFIKDEIVYCPISLTSVSDPRNMDSSPETIEWIMKFPESMTEDDVESFYGDSIEFESDTDADFYDSYYESEYEIKEKITSELDLILKSARFNNLDKEVKNKESISKTYKRKL